MARLHDLRAESSVDPVTKQPTYYWVSRDSHETTGELSEFCHLWCVKPMRRSMGSGCRWTTIDVTPEGETLAGFQGVYTLDAVKKWCNTLPETDRELLVVGRPGG